MNLRGAGKHVLEVPVLLSYAPVGALYSLGLKDE